MVADQQVKCSWGKESNEPSQTNSSAGGGSGSGTPHQMVRLKHRITAILKVKTDIITNIWFVVMSVEAFRTHVIVYIGDVVMILHQINR